MSTHWDLLCLGSGEAAKVLAWHYASTYNKCCAVIERSMLGGSCPNVACLPSKNLLYSAKAAHLARQGAQFGLAAQKGDVEYGAVKKRKDEMVRELGDLHRGMFEGSGVELIWGEGRFVGEKRVEVTDANGERKVLTADVVVVNTGSRAKIPDNIPGLVEAKPLTHVELLDLEDLPRHLIVLGGGYVGLELAQAMKRLGAQVTVFERGSRILKNEDPDIAAVLQNILTEEGIDFKPSTSVTRVQGLSGQEVTLTLSDNTQLKGTHILCAAGRIPNTQNIGLDLAGIKLKDTGHILVDENNLTTAPGVYAAGDCAGSPYFTHMGLDDFRIIRDSLTNKPQKNRRSTRQVPSSLFTDPEIAHVGMREHEANSKGVKYRLAKLPMDMFLRTRTMEKGATRGFAKVLISAENDTILGFTVVGPHAGELLPVVQLAIEKGLPYTDVRDLILVHPTINEGLGMLFDNVPSSS
ncbi:hypothetical protein PRZ48_004568 [Zasmidium cellare]|uniref:Mercuric reductase n=1 Tax=Zasmidium cellare TaxID=395010 RepID=A0ABR0ERD0_ZASCE|nr:hypothetical protein PRZ48_004568 [Zasmidium cellare]